MTGSTAPISIVKVPMAGVGLGCRDTVLETLLGSCVGVAIYDPTSGIGGLVHVMLPESRGASDNPWKYADTAVVRLRQELLQAGANPYILLAKIAGGARMYGPMTDRDVGTRNCEAVLKHLEAEQIRLIAKDIGGTKERMLRFCTGSGNMMILFGRKVVRVL